MKVKENELVEKCKIEMMALNALQEHLKSTEKECNKLIKEGDDKIQQLKEEVHQLKIKEHCKQKETEINKKEAKHLKQNL